MHSSSSCSPNVFLSCPCPWEPWWSYSSPRDREQERISYYYTIWNEMKNQRENSHKECLGYARTHMHAHTNAETHKHTKTKLTGKLSLTVSTGTWKGHANWCFHRVFNTTFSRYWKGAYLELIKLWSSTVYMVKGQRGPYSSVNIPPPVAGWSVVWVWRDSMFQGVGGWMREVAGQREGAGCCLRPVRPP